MTAPIPNSRTVRSASDDRQRRNSIPCRTHRGRVDTRRGRLRMLGYVLLLVERRDRVPSPQRVRGVLRPSQRTQPSPLTKHSSAAISARICHDPRGSVDERNTFRAVPPGCDNSTSLPHAHLNRRLLSLTFLALLDVRHFAATWRLRFTLASTPRQLRSR